MNVSATAAEWAADQAKTEAEAFEQAMSRIISPAEFKVNDEVEQAYRNGFNSGIEQARKQDDIRIEKIADHYGYTLQSDIMLEECAELQKAILKLRRGWSNDRLAELLGEIADVYIVVHQLRYIFGIENVNKIIDSKLDRQLERIRSEESES